MRKDGTLESWDELALFNYKEELGPKGTQYVTPKQKRAFNVDIDTAMAYIDESLQDNQGWHRQDDINPYKITFPYAPYLNIGQKIDCLDTGAAFTVKWVEEKEINIRGNKRKYKTGVVEVTGQHEPDERFRLRMREGERFIFRKSYPKAMAPAYKFDENSQLKRNSAAWTDTISYMVTTRTPGSQSGEMFGGRKEIKPRFREMIQKTGDQTVFIGVEGQWFDNLVQFDIWSQTNERADELLNAFEEFMQRYTWIFKWNGVQEILYYQRNQDELVTRWRNDIVHRSVEYFFRTERLWAHQTRRTVSLALTIDPATREESTEDLFKDIVDPSNWPNFYTGEIPVEIVDGTGELIIQYPQ